MPRDIMGITTYTADEVAEILGITKRSLLAYLKKGLLIGSKIGGRWQFTEAQVHEYLNKGSIVHKGGNQQQQP